MFVVFLFVFLILNVQSFHCIYILYSFIELLEVLCQCQLFTYNLVSYCTVYTYSAVRDPLLMIVLLRASEFQGQLGAVDVGVQLSYRAQHDHLRHKHTITYMSFD